ncbi:beta-microseminoprotein, partial [Petaurus breviceps papuanus]|uniref:beta-microseminoprotein n=1 Tax=Petaurus breviceps papuanus TaxID=3040969 RepID=UPI0036DB9D2A
NAMLGVLLALAIFVTLCYARCSYTPLKITDGSPPSGCKDRYGAMHEFNRLWIYNCMHCSCDSRIGLTCCLMLMKPRLYDRKHCKIILDQQTCMFIPVNKAKPSKKCEVSDYVN